MLAFAKRRNSNQSYAQLFHVALLLAAFEVNTITLFYNGLNIVTTRLNQQYRHVHKTTRLLP